MRRPAKGVSWVVYRTGADARHGPVNGVCEQGEWDAMERERPGRHTLVRCGIASEAEAETIARAALVAAEAARVEERRLARRN